MTTVGTGKYTYQLIENWAKLPAGQTFGNTSAVTTDSRDRVYVFQRKDPPVMIFDREGNFLDSWGAGVITDPHGICIHDDIVYLTDRSDSVALKFTLEGKPLQILGDRGVHSDTGGERPGDLVPPGRRPVQLPHRAGALSFGRPLRLRWIPQRPGAPLLRGWPAHFVLGRAGQGGAEPVPPAPQRTGGRGRHGVRLRPGE